MPLLRKADYVTLAGLVFGGGLILLALVWINGCGPKEQIAIEHQVVVSSYAAELALCRAKAKADSGTFAEYQVCACGIDAKYKVDAGGCQ